MKLLGSNYKLDKAVPGFQLLGLSLAPHSLSGVNLCPHSTPECRAVCLGTETGMNRFATAIRAKKARSELFNATPAYFKLQLVKEIEANMARAAQSGHRLAIRLNVYSDIEWETEWPELFKRFPEVQFYDYTKIPGRFDRPSNYHLTYSRSGTAASDKASEAYFKKSVNTAVVFDARAGAELPAEYLGRRVVDGDLSDFRPGDDSGVVVGLRFKGGHVNLTKAPRFVVIT